jgi:hypothetical protein
VSIDDRLRALHQDGFVLMQGVLDARQIADLRHAIDQLKPLHWDYSGGVDHYKCVFNRDPFKGAALHLDYLAMQCIRPVNTPS